MYCFECWGQDFHTSGACLERHINSACNTCNNLLQDILNLVRQDSLRSEYKPLRI